MDGIKRTMDIAVAGCLLVVAAPVILLAGIIIRMTSPGPALFSQQRVGRGEALFRCHKLRTMKRGTPSLPTHETAIDFVTPVGRSLRRCKIDELPQLWNVLKGEMSLVGPRPSLPSQRELIHCRREFGIFVLRPGITGLTQVRGIDMSNPARCAASDRDYLAARSLKVDLLVLAATFGLGKKTFRHPQDDIAP